RKLPHHLVDAFGSTLEEAKYSDLILHVVDASEEEAETQMHVVYETLYQLGIKDKTVVTVFNKMDLADPDRVLKDGRADLTVRISAKTGEGIAGLLDKIGEILREKRIFLEKVFGYHEVGQIALVRKYGQVLTEEYRGDGIYVSAYVPRELYHSLLGE
ncbi:MAG: GTPase HflX, partial [Lachnospiraceae bacterium]|nr:GTPase HflX [Lachnospiraceae bacterium]